jgi:uncharacterized MnhB-related membrane protein
VKKKFHISIFERWLLSVILWAYAGYLIGVLIWLLTNPDVLKLALIGILGSLVILCIMFYVIPRSNIKEK